MYWSPGLAVAIASTIAPPLSFSSAWHGTACMNRSVLFRVSPLWMSERVSEWVCVLFSFGSFIRFHSFHALFVFISIVEQRSPSPLPYATHHTTTDAHDQLHNGTQSKVCVCARFINIHLYLPFFGSFVVNGSLETPHTHNDTTEKKKKRENKIQQHPSNWKAQKKEKLCKTQSKKKAKQKVTGEWMNEWRMRMERDQKSEQTKTGDDERRNSSFTGESAQRIGRKRVWECERTFCFELIANGVHEICGRHT